MMKFIQNRAVIIAISLSFFGFGFSILGNMIELTTDEIWSGLLSGLACGITVLLVTTATSSDLPAQVRDRLMKFAITGRGETSHERPQTSA
jgi:hypothetical protein